MVNVAAVFTALWPPIGYRVILIEKITRTNYEVFRVAQMDELKFIGVKVRVISIIPAYRW